MKKAILLTALIISVLCVSCGNDDDGGNTDVIIGRWQLEQTFTNGDSNEISDCEKQQDIEFLMSSNFISAVYELQEENGESTCIRPGDVSGSWKNEGDNQYKLNTESGEPAVYEIIVQGNKLSLSISLGMGNEKIDFRAEYKKV